MTDADSDLFMGDLNEATNHTSFRKRKRSQPTDERRVEHKETTEAQLIDELFASSGESPSSVMKSDDGCVRSIPAKIADAVPIPGSFEECSEADRTLWDMRKAGKPWNDIREEWERLTGQKTAATTLPGRFTRMRDKIGDFNETDDELLIKCKQQLEKTFANVLWDMVSEAMVAQGGNKFSAAAIKKRFGELNENHNLQGVVTAAAAADDDGDHY